MPKVQFGTQRFRWGISIDNVWIYAGFQQPKSVIIPYVLSVRLPRGPIRVAPDIDTRTIQNELEGEEERNNLNGVGWDRRLMCRELARELRSRNIDFIRCWFPWNFFEPSISSDAPVYQFPMDDFVNEMKSAGIDVIAVLANGYSRFLPKGINLEDSKQYVERMTRMTGAVVSHYKDSVSMWQIENEPNWWEEHYATHWRSGGIWLESGIQELILETLHDSVRNQDANATILINLEADNRKTNWSFYAKYCDILGLDFYPNYMRSSPIDTSEFKLSVDVRKETGIPVYVAETGYPSGPAFLGYGESKQAEYVESACKESFACESIAALSMWRYSDSYWSSFPFQENYFGLITKEGRPKPAWTKYYEQIMDHH